MNKVIWKAYRLIEIFKRITPPSTNIVAKELDIFDEPFDGSVALITRAETNNGIRGYIEKKDYPTLTGAITYNDQFSFFLYHNYEFTTIKDHLSVIKALSDNFQKILDNEVKVNIFLTTILNHVYSKEIFNFNFTGADYRFDREIILLPCLEVREKDDWIWEENGKYYTLAVDYIKKLMDEAKELREQKTIRLYEAEKKKYEAEYLKEKHNVVWKGYELGGLFDYDSGDQLSSNKKALNVSKEKDDTHTIALITQSEKNNGVSGYLEPNEEIENKKKNGFMTYSMHFGLCFYHDYDFVLMDTHGSVFKLTAKSEEFNKLLKNDKELNYYLSKIITKICSNNIYNYSWLPNSTRTGREIILLPCLEVREKDNWIWEENGKYYTLATNYISYIYLQGRCNYYQKLIDKWTYQY